MAYIQHIATCIHIHTYIHTYIHLHLTGEPSSDPSHVDYVPSVFCYSNKECSKKRQQSEDRYQLITQKRLEHLSKQAAAVETDSQHGNSGSEDAECDKSEGVVMKVEVGVQTDEMLRTCKYGCDVNNNP